MKLPEVLRTLRRWLRPPRTLRVTRAGRTYLVLTMGIGLGALNTGNNLLYLVLGVQLATIVASGILSEASLRGLHIRRLGAEAAFAGEPFVYRWAISRRRGPAFVLTLAETHPELKGSATLALLQPGRGGGGAGPPSGAAPGPLCPAGDSGDHHLPARPL